MEYFVQQLINGLALGSIYGLIAIGYTMVYGIIGMINFAHGDIFMVGAFGALIVIVGLGAVGFGGAGVLIILALLAARLIAAVSLHNKAVSQQVVWGYQHGSFGLGN